MVSYPLITLKVIFTQRLSLQLNGEVFMSSTPLSIDSLWVILAEKQQERKSTLLSLIDSLEQMKCYAKNSDNQELTELVEQAIDQCQYIKMLN